MPFDTEPHSGGGGGGGGDDRHDGLDVYANRVLVTAHDLLQEQGKCHSCFAACLASQAIANMVINEYDDPYIEDQVEITATIARMVSAQLAQMGYKNAKNRKIST